MCLIVQDSRKKGRLAPCSLCLSNEKLEQRPPLVQLQQLTSLSLLSHFLAEKMGRQPASLASFSSDPGPGVFSRVPLSRRAALHCRPGGGPVLTPGSPNPLSPWHPSPFHLEISILIRLSHHLPCFIPTRKPRQKLFGRLDRNFDGSF